MRRRAALVFLAGLEAAIVCMAWLIIPPLRHPYNSESSNIAAIRLALAKDQTLIQAVGVILVILTLILAFKPSKQGG